MSDLQSAALPLAAMLAAFIIISFSLFLARHVARWVERKNQIVKADRDGDEGKIDQAKRIDNDPNDQTGC